jgi:hypothetical protein
MIKAFLYLLEILKLKILLTSETWKNKEEGWYIGSSWIENYFDLSFLKGF